MTTRILVNVGFLLLVGVLTALVVWEPGKEAPHERERLTNLNLANIDRVRIERVGQAAVAAQRGDDGEWELTEPRGLPANGRRIDSLLKVAEAVTRSRFPVQGNLEEFALSEPGVTLQLNDVILAFGDSTPIGEQRYVLKGDSIYLIGASYYYHLIGGIGTFISHKLLPEDAFLEAITLPELELLQREGRWSIMPEAADISADTIAELVNNWRHAQAMEVKDWEAPTPAGETIRVRLAGEKSPVEFVIVSRGPQTVLVRPDWGLAYPMPDSAAGDLLSLPVSRKARGERTVKGRQTQPEVLH